MMIPHAITAAVAIISVLLMAFVGPIYGYGFPAVVMVVSIFLGAMGLHDSTAGHGIGAIMLMMYGAITGCIGLAAAAVTHLVTVAL